MISPILAQPRILPATIHTPGAVNIRTIPRPIAPPHPHTVVVVSYIRITFITRRPRVHPVALIPPITRLITITIIIHCFTMPTTIRMGSTTIITIIPVRATRQRTAVVLDRLARL